MPSAPAPPLQELSPEILHELLEHAADGVYLSERQGEDVIVTWANQRGCELLRRPHDQLLGRRLSDLFWDPDELQRRPLDFEAISRGTFASVRAMRGGDGSRVVVDVSVRRLANGTMVTFARDVTERVDAQERIIRSESSFRALIERSPDGIAVHRDGVFVYANSAAARILGLESPSELVGALAIEVIHPDDRPRAAERLAAMASGQPSVPFVEERLLRRDGSVVVCSVAALRVEFGGEPSIAVIGRDVTEQRRMMAQLAQAERLASIGVLAAGVGHEINNPLTYVILRLGAAAVLERRMRAAGLQLQRDVEALVGSSAADALLGEDLGVQRLDELAGHLASAQDGAARIQQIVSDLRLFSRATDEGVAPIDVRVPLERALAMASHELKHRARVTTDLGPTPAVMANEGRLAQVFLNLLLNAAQAIPEGAPERHRVTVRTAHEDGWAVIEIADSGDGIAEDVLPRLFEPFFTTKPVGAGSGLGLAVSHGIVVALEGRIEVESRLGHGSTFRVVLPPTQVAPTVAPPSPPRAPPSSSRSARILVVDDELSLARAVALLLDRYGEVMVESCGEHAQDRLARGEAFDVVLCDLVMPVMSGFELYRWIDVHRPELSDRVVFMSGGRLGDEERGHSERHPERWLRKPFDADKLEAAVLRVLRRDAG
jgi:two-component system cell cycle sensor histidine kinase/response regulator CckA